jgi:N utilization substance protein A
LLDEENKTIEVAVSEENLAIAIGRRGQNVRLASELSGWNIEIITTSEEQEKRSGEIEEARTVFCEGLDVDDDFANLLIAEGFMKLEELAYCDVDEIALVPGLNEELAQEIQTRSRNALLNQALKQQEGEGLSLLELSGVDQEVAIQLAALGILSVEALADAAIDDLEPLQGLEISVKEALILAAREASGWFDE